MDGGRRQNSEWQSSSGGRSGWNRIAEVKGSKPTSAHPHRNINSLSNSMDGGPRTNYSSGASRRTNGAPTTVPPVGSLSIHGRTATGSSSTLTHGIYSKGMSMDGGKMDITALNLGENSLKKGGSMDTGTKIDAKMTRRNLRQEDAAKQHRKPTRAEALPDPTAYTVIEHQKFLVLQDPRSNRRNVANNLDLRKTVNIGARDVCGCHEATAKSGGEEPLAYSRNQTAETDLNSRGKCKAQEKRRPPSGEEEVKLTSLVVEMDVAESVAESLRARVKASDMPSSMQIHAFRCARSACDSHATFSSKQLAFALKKEFDKAYGVAWHCIVGTSFGSFVTHSAGGFLYFSIDRVTVLLFKTAVERLGYISDN